MHKHILFYQRRLGISTVERRERKERRCLRFSVGFPGNALTASRASVATLAIFASRRAAKTLVGEPPQTRLWDKMALLTKSLSVPPCQQKKTPTGVTMRTLSSASGSMRSQTRGSGPPLPLSLVAKRALSCARASARKTSPRTRPAAASVPLDKQARGCASNCAAGPPQSS